MAGVGGGGSGSTAHEAPHPALHPPTVRPGGWRWRGQRVEHPGKWLWGACRGSFSLAHTGSQAGAPGPGAKGRPASGGGLDSTHRPPGLPNPSVHQSFRERAAPGVPNRVRPQQESPAGPNKCFLAAGAAGDGTWSIPWATLVPPGRSES